MKVHPLSIAVCLLIGLELSGCKSRPEPGRIPAVPGSPIGILTPTPPTQPYIELSPNDTYLEIPSNSTKYTLIFYDPDAAPNQNVWVKFKKKSPCKTGTVEPLQAISPAYPKCEVEFDAANPGLKEPNGYIYTYGIGKPPGETTDGIIICKQCK